jgi:DNA-binding NarL/FixJ family response regulator
MTERILIVDDHPLTRDALSGLLAQHGFDVVGLAAGGEEAIGMAAELQPDLVLLDLSMPGMDGLEALPRIKAVAPDTKIIVFSGFSARRLAERSLALGADEYVEKGAPMDAIRETVRAA